MRRVAVYLSLLAAIACRSEESRVSGQPYECTCELEDGAGEANAVTCAQNASGAVELALACLADDGLGPRFCVCVEHTTTWCDLGSCTR